MSKAPSFFKRVLRPFATNDVETGNSDWYPELEPKTYPVEPSTTIEAIVSVIEKRPRWEASSVDKDEGRVEFTAKTKRMGFIDDVTVDVAGDSDSSEVSVHSRSREGKGDFGKNASRIREFYDRLATELRMT
jgi:uncharacterized protein (DUF1499 family)